MLSTIRPPCDILCHHPLHTSCKRCETRNANTQKWWGRVFFVYCRKDKYKNTCTNKRMYARKHTQNTRHQQQRFGMEFLGRCTRNQWAKLVSQPNLPPPFAFSGSTLATTLSEPDTHKQQIRQTSLLTRRLSRHVVFIGCFKN